MRRALFITGGTGGLGTAVVARLEKTYECHLLRRPDVDLADEASTRAAIRRAVETLGPPYGLVHMTGGWTGGTVSETSSDTLAEMLRLNLMTSFHAIRETLAVMDRTRPGRLLAISSIATLRRDAASAAYTISKGALNTLIETTAAELRGTPITVNALLPDALATPAAGDAMGLVPLEKVADAIELLLSDAASGMQGALIPIR
jgi:NAD(P)-dependent dehydrogenase (short-subunit alcohol dehydrogenase family)